MQSIVITGGNGGLGTAVVERLSRDYRCIVLDRAQMDVTREESVRHAFSELGELYAVVHLVGGFAAGNLSKTTSETWSRMLDLNLTAAFLTLREALPRLTRPGRIVAVSSIATLTPSGSSVAYSVSKSALNALVQSVAAEHRGSGLTVNAVLPDAMATPAMLKEMDAAQLVPLERVVETIAFLLSDAAAGITGTLIPIRK
ncbi:MAG TPA: SDR family oxidoreductase [Thermoanaerobaculia bacterium]|nr:SDR family oxidoreductase [Thermoanaerobaculia bacterium]